MSREIIFSFVDKKHNVKYDIFYYCSNIAEDLARVFDLDQVSFEDIDNKDAYCKQFSVKEFRNILFTYLDNELKMYSDDFNGYKREYDRWQNQLMDAISRVTDSQNQETVSEVLNYFNDKVEEMYHMMQFVEDEEIKPLEEIKNRVSTFLDLDFIAYPNKEDQYVIEVEYSF